MTDKKDIVTADRETILEKHCPSMNLLYLDSNGRAFRERIFNAMEEYATLQKELIEASVKKIYKP